MIPRKPRVLRGPNEKRNGRFGMPGPNSRVVQEPLLARVKCPKCKATFLASTADYWLEKHERDFHCK
jgi:hypothetical protein